MGSVTIDVLDRRIIQALYIDPRASFSRLADVLGSSEQTVSRRYRRLFDSRILRVVGQLDSQRLGQSDWAVRIRCAPGSAPIVAAKLAQHPDISWVQLTSGGTEIFSTIHSRSGEQQTPLLLWVVCSAWSELPQPWGNCPTRLSSAGQAVDRSPEYQAAGL
jgi:DNA-binding Lrp family transcriptional regulator